MSFLSRASERLSVAAFFVLLAAGCGDRELSGDEVLAAVSAGSVQGAEAGSADAVADYNNVAKPQPKAFTRRSRLEMFATAGARRSRRESPCSIAEPFTSARQSPSSRSLRKA